MRGLIIHYISFCTINYPCCLIRYVSFCTINFPYFPSHSFSVLQHKWYIINHLHYMVYYTSHIHMKILWRIYTCKNYNTETRSRY
jgi:hypothetical protein